MIPVTQWAEAEGERGRMTRTWYALHGSDLFAVAGIWRPTAEWGDAYSMVMVDGCAQMSDVHDRMPVILTEANWRTWTDGNASEAFALCQTCPDPLDRHSACIRNRSTEVRTHNIMHRSRLCDCRRVD